MPQSKDAQLDSVTKERIDVLVTSWFYVPAYRGGGPIQTLKALIAAAPAEFCISVICANHDLGEDAPLVDRPNDWLRVDRSHVRYVQGGLRALLAAYSSAPHPDLVYLNSLFNPRYSVLPIVLCRLGLWRGATLLIAPRGELSPGALALKTRKKRLFLHLSRIVGLNHFVVWHASTDEEASDIRAVFGERSRILVRENETSLSSNAKARSPRSEGHLRLLFVSRLHPKKGLLILLEALAGISEPVCLDIVGAFEDPAYEERCRAVIRRLPEQIFVEFRGALPREAVFLSMRQADLVAFPTAGENFGHVIAEALSESCPVMCSAHTPWSDRLAAGGGAVVSPNTPEAWRAALLEVLLQDPVTWQRASERAGRAYDIWRNEAKGRHVFELTRQQGEGR